MLTRTVVEDDDVSLHSAVKDNYAKSVEVCGNGGDASAKQYQRSLTTEEIMFLAIHYRTGKKRGALILPNKTGLLLHDAGKT